MEIESKIIEKANRLIGHCICEHVVLEKMMQSYITKHFCDDKAKRSEFLEYVICQHIPFDKTREIFVSLIKRHNKEFYYKNKGDFLNIDVINNERNILGHYLIDLTKSGIDLFNENGSIAFLKFKNGSSIEVFDSKRVKDYLEKVKKIKDLIGIIK